MIRAQLAMIVALSLAPPALAQQRSFSHERYDRVLQRFVDDKGLVNYKGLKADRADLDAYIESLAKLHRRTFDSWGEKEQIALLINAYNAFVLRIVIDHYPIEGGFLKSLKYPRDSIQHIKDVWKKPLLKLMGEPISLDGIEHGTLRKRYDEPRIHMAVNCASKSCATLRAEPYTGEELDKQLEDQTQQFLADSKKFRIDRERSVVYLSPLFKWFGKDFVKAYAPKEGFGRGKAEQRAVLNFVSQNLDDENARYLRGGDYRVKWLDYDWSLNEQPSGK